MNAVVELSSPLARLPAAEAQLPGGAAAHARRRGALDRLLALGLPTTRDDAWKYTNLRLLGRRELTPAAPRPVAVDWQGSVPVHGGPTLLFVDGRYHGGPSAAALPAGLAFTPLAALLDGSPSADIEMRLGATDSADDRIRLLNSALLADGGLLEIGAAFAASEPVRVVYLATGGGAYPRLLVTVAPGARATLVEYHLAPGDAESLSAPVTDLELGAGAGLEHYSVGLAGNRAVQLEDVAVRVGRDATYRHRHLALGAQLARLDLRVRLEGTGANTELIGLLVAEHSQQIDVRTRLDHVAAHTTSHQVYRGVANGRGRGSYDGKVLVHAGASKADSRQSSRNLLLSPQASIDTRPQLEINTDDVKCSHGATTGTLDEQMLFYLLSRGLDRDTARALLTFAFAEDVVAKVAIAPLRRFVEERVLGRLPAGDLIRDFIA